MKDDPLLSVIIPIYNTEKYLERCLSSICNQTYQNLEIICVDDGSTDQSGDILDSFAKNDYRIIAFHQSNHGESHARNQGLINMTGDLVAFCDSDDWVELDMYQVLVKNLIRFEADISLGSWYKEEEGKSIPIINNKDVSETFGQSKLMRYIFERDQYQAFAYMWNKVFHRKLFYHKDELVVRFDESMRVGEDVVMLAQLVVQVEKAVFTEIPFYHYRVRKKSCSHTHDIRRLEEWAKSYEIVRKMLFEKGVDKNTLFFVDRFLAYRYSNIVEEAIRQNNKTVKKKYQKKMQERSEIYYRTNIGNNRRINRYRELLLV